MRMHPYTVQQTITRPSTRIYERTLCRRATTTAMAAAAPPATRPAPAMGGLVGTVPLPSVPVGFMPPPMEEWPPPMPMLPVVTTVKGGALQSEVGMGSRVTMSSVVGAGLQSGQMMVVLTSAARAAAARVSQYTVRPCCATSMILDRQTGTYWPGKQREQRTSL